MSSSTPPLTPVGGWATAVPWVRDHTLRIPSDYAECQWQPRGGAPVIAQGQPSTPEQRAQPQQVGKSDETPPKCEAPHIATWTSVNQGCSVAGGALKVPPGMLKRAGTGRLPTKDSWHIAEEVAIQREALKPLTDFSITMPRLGVGASLRSIEDLPAPLRHALYFIRDLPALPHTVLPRDVCAFLPPHKGPEPQKPTLVLDLDETLAHCARGEGRSHSPVPGQAPPDLIVQFDDTLKFGHVYFRPYVHLFLEVAAKSFEIVVFTASQQTYADKVINALDPTCAYISHRLYRQHCTELRGAYFKELGLLGRPLSQCLLVDNSVISVACNPHQGVLIRSWYSDRDDQELVDLVALLRDMQNSGRDVGTFLSGRYGLHEFFQGLREVS